MVEGLSVEGAGCEGRVEWRKVEKILGEGWMFIRESLLWKMEAKLGAGCLLIMAAVREERICVGELGAG